MEDARFTRFTDDDGRGRVPRHLHRLRRPPDRAAAAHQSRPAHVPAHRLAGPAARNKGMALFPRMIDGRHWPLCRTDGESTSRRDLAGRLRLGAPQADPLARRVLGDARRSATAARRSRPTAAGWC